MTTSAKSETVEKIEPLATVAGERPLVELVELVERGMLIAHLAAPALIALSTRVRVAGRRLVRELERLFMVEMGASVPVARTRRLYGADLRRLVEFLSSEGRAGFPIGASQIIRYIDGHAEQREAVYQIDRTLAAVSAIHNAAMLPNPCKDIRVREARIAVRQRFGLRAPQRGRFGIDLLLCCLESMRSDDLIDLRDRCLFLFAFAAQLRPQEILALKVNDIELSDDTLVIRKLDGIARIAAEHEPRHFPICAVAAYRMWLAASGLQVGHVFCSVFDLPVAGFPVNVPLRPLTDRALRGVVKQRMRRAAIGEGISINSLRHGFLIMSAGRGGGPFGDQAKPILLSDYLAL